MNAVVRKKFDTFVLSSGSSWSPKTIVWFHLYEMSRIGKSVETGSRFVVSGERAGVFAGMRSCYRWIMWFIFGMMEMF